MHLLLFNRIMASKRTVEIFAKQITWYYSHLQQNELLSQRPEYFFDNIMNHDRTNDAEILPVLFNQWSAHNKCSFMTSWNSWCIDVWLIPHWQNCLLQSCNFTLQRFLYSHCFICSSNQSIPRKSGKIRVYMKGKPFAIALQKCLTTWHPC